MSSTVTFLTAGFAFLVVPVCDCFSVPQPENDTDERSFDARTAILAIFFIAGSLPSPDIIPFQ
jgi:hypothetical protein